MKKGSADDPFSEDPEPTESSPTGEQSATVEDQSDNDRVSPRTLPYIYKRGAVKEGRNQRPVYLREYNEERIPELVDAVEIHLGEDITKTDLLEAAMETAIENPQLVADILRTERYGYDWE